MADARKLLRVVKVAGNSAATHPKMLFFEEKAVRIFFEAEGL
jgi:hypothetical protein